MSSPIRLADIEHFSLVRESLSQDGLHVAMVGRDRRHVLDYAATLAVALVEQDGWHIEKYDPQRLETLIVDLMLNRYDAALQTLSDHAHSSISPRLAGCVLFIPDAQSMPRATFQQLVRLVAGTRDRRLRLVALFVGDGPASEERIAAMGPQVARWDLDDVAPNPDRHELFPRAASDAFRSTTSGRDFRGSGRLLAAATVTAALALLPMMWPAVSEITPDFAAHKKTVSEPGSVFPLAGELGPESLPITVKPDNGADSDTDAEVVRP